MEGSQGIVAGDADADPRRNLTMPLFQKASRKMQREARKKANTAENLTALWALVRISRNRS